MGAIGDDVRSCERHADDPGRAASGGRNHAHLRRLLGAGEWTASRTQRQPPRRPARRIRLDTDELLRATLYVAVHVDRSRGAALATGSGTTIATLGARIGDRSVGLTCWMAMRARPRIGCTCLTFCSAPHRGREPPRQRATAPPWQPGRVVMGAHNPTASVRQVSFLNCPRCGLSLRPRVSWLTIEQWLRCMARARIPITLLSSPLPTIERYGGGFAPSAQSPANRPGIHGLQRTARISDGAGPTACARQYRGPSHRLVRSRRWRCEPAKRSTTPVMAFSRCGLGGMAARSGGTRSGSKRS